MGAALGLAGHEVYFFCPYPGVLADLLHMIKGLTSGQMIHDGWWGGAFLTVTHDYCHNVLYPIIS